MPLSLEAEIVNEYEKRCWTSASKASKYIKIYHILQRATDDSKHSHSLSTIKHAQCRKLMAGICLRKLSCPVSSALHAFEAALGFTEAQLFTHAALCLTEAIQAIREKKPKYGSIAADIAAFRSPLSLSNAPLKPNTLTSQASSLALHNGGSSITSSAEPLASSSLTMSEGNRLKLLLHNNHGSVSPSIASRILDSSATVGGAAGLPPLPQHFLSSLTLNPSLAPGFFQSRNEQSLSTTSASGNDDINRFTETLQQVFVGEIGASAEANCKSAPTGSRAAHLSPTVTGGNSLSSADRFARRFRWLIMRAAIFLLHLSDKARSDLQTSSSSIASLEVRQAQIKQRCILSEIDAILLLKEIQTLTECWCNVGAIELHLPAEEKKFGFASALLKTLMLAEPQPADALGNSPTENSRTIAVQSASVLTPPRPNRPRIDSSDPSRTYPIPVDHDLNRLKDELNVALACALVECVLNQRTEQLPFSAESTSTKQSHVSSSSLHPPPLALPGTAVARSGASASAGAGASTATLEVFSPGSTSCLSEARLLFLKQSGAEDVWFSNSLTLSLLLESSHSQLKIQTTLQALFNQANNSPAPNNNNTDLQLDHQRHLINLTYRCDFLLLSHLVTLMVHATERLSYSRAQMIEFDVANSSSCSLRKNVANNQRSFGSAVYRHKTVQEFQSTLAASLRNCYASSPPPNEAHELISCTIGVLRQMWAFVQLGSYVASDIDRQFGGVDLSTSPTIAAKSVSSATTSSGPVTSSPPTAVANRLRVARKMLRQNMSNAILNEFDTCLSLYQRRRWPTPTASTTDLSVAITTSSFERLLKPTFQSIKNLVRAHCQRD